ncbi:MULTISPECIES: hypothetical protein [unclassified Chryseobacterium]|uniref:hypothetical protein n=1 Tax=unclassified Chryseobacterium TaxID=2593645 RepID=UPI000F451B4A|nr:hypothetical protein [Chryseobacterium sp. G0240]ROI02307.1 hypothetical protein EGI16_15665 [Chryseobacterium sp. G0240]
MKTKQEIKQYFENGDIPDQEQFWEWQDSYWHKDEKIPSAQLDYDFSKKADLINGKVPASQLPSYVDDVIEFPNLSAFPATGEEGKIFVALDTNILYRWSGSTYINITQAGIEELKDLVDRGNYTGSKGWLSFLPSDNSKDGDRDGAIGINSDTYSFFFGNMNPNHTGVYNTSYGYNSLSNVTEGQSNTAAGHFSGKDLTTGTANTIMGLESATGLTTGNDNTLIGVSSGYGLKEGTGNAFLGKWTGCFITGNNNTFLGYQAGQFWGKGGTGFWSSNIVVGGGTSGHPNGIWGENNVIIGSNLELIGNNSNRFIINSYTSKANRWYNTHFIEGNFADRWLKFDTSLQVLRLPQADSTFTRILVSKPDGTFGWEDKTNSESIPLTGTLPNKPVTGDISIKNSTNSTMLSSGYVFCSDSSANGTLMDSSALKFLESGSGIIAEISQQGIITGDTYLLTCNGSNARGFSGAYDYTSNVKELDYIQKKYADKQHSYTTEEEKTGGLWINNKPVYKKTLFFDQIPENGEILIDKFVEEVEVIISNQMFTEWYAIDAAFAGNHWMSKAFITLDKRAVSFQLMEAPDYDYSVINSFALTLEYTKKGDQPVV